MDTIFFLDLMLLILVTGFLGGRLFHILFENFSYYQQHPLRILYVWNGGFVFYGGLLTVLITTYGFCQKRKQPFWLWANFLTPYISLIYALGRLGCFLSGCCYGKICSLPWAWAVTFPHQEPIGALRHPTQLYLMAYELVFLTLYLIMRHIRPKLSPPIFLCWLLGHSLWRFIIEFFRDDYRGHTWIGTLSPSQCLSLGLFLTSTALLNFHLRKHPTMKQKSK